MSSPKFSLGHEPISIRQGESSTFTTPTSISSHSIPTPPIPTQTLDRRDWLPGSSPSAPPRRLSLKSTSIAELSPTAAYSKSKSLPVIRKDSTSPGRLSNTISFLTRTFSRGKGKEVAESNVQHIGITLPTKLDYPLSQETIDELEEVKYQVRDILIKNDWAVKQVKKAADNCSSGAEHSGESEGHKRVKRRSDTSPNGFRSPLRGGRRSTVDLLLTGKDSPSTPATKEGPDCRVLSIGGKKGSSCSSPGGESSSSTPSSRSHSFSRRCPRIRREEDITDYAQRLDVRQPHSSAANSSKSASPTNLDGAADGLQKFTNMNNFSNFDQGNLNPNLARQAPPQPQAQQMNGLNGVQQWPNVGAQSDMNVLWEYIVKLSDMHEQIRAQTQSVASGMQQIDAMRANNNGVRASASPHVNGAVNGLPPPTTESTEVARLQTDLLAAHSKIEDLTSYITTLQSLNTEYENAISHSLDKLRPFAQSHAQALLAQKAHYIHLLEQERSANLELRLEQSRWQERAKKIKDNMVEALKAQSEMEVGYVRKIAALKSDNRSLRRICGVPLLEESEDDDEEKNGIGSFESAAMVQESARQSPQQARMADESAIVEGGGDGGRRIIIS